MTIKQSYGHCIIYVDTGRIPTREQIIEQMMLQDPIISDEEAFLRHLIKKWNGDVE